MQQVSVLLSLARHNSYQDIKACLQQHGLKIDACNQMGQTALHIAALWGNCETIALCVELGCPPSIPNMKGTTPLHFAAGAKSNALPACRILLSLGADPRIIDMSGRAPYEMASNNTLRGMLGGPDPRIFQFATEGKAKQLAQLLSQEGSGGKVSMRLTDDCGMTPLSLAIERESLATVQVILRHDPPVLNIPDTRGNTALHVAAEVGNLEVLQYLLSLKPETINDHNLDQSEYSAGNWTSRARGEVDTPLDKSPLAVAVAAGDVDIAKALLEAGAKVEALDYEQRTPLLIALEEEHYPIVHVLLEWGANPNVAAPNFISCLHFLATRGPVELITKMVEKGARVNHLGNNAGHLSSKSTQNVSAKNSQDGWTPLHLASRAGKVDRMAALISAGADLTLANIQGNTPLHLAAVNGHLAAVQLLMQHLGQGAYAVLANKAGQAPADLAQTEAVRTALQPRAIHSSA